jgi:hypothetical protein
MLCILLFFSGCCLKTEVFKQLYYPTEIGKAETDLSISAVKAGVASFFENRRKITIAGSGSISKNSLRGFTG